VKLPGLNRSIAVTAISALALSHNATAQQSCASRGYGDGAYGNGGYYQSGYDNRGYYDNYHHGRGRAGNYDRARSGMGSGMGMGSGSGYSDRAYGYDRGYQRSAPPAYRYDAPRGSYYAHRYPDQVYAQAQTQEQEQNNAAAKQTAASSRVDVRIAGMQYSPAPLKVRVGEQVVWKNSDGMPHTVTSSDGGPLDSGQLGMGDTYSFSFTEPGTYEYYCTYHPSMTGTVIVE
jgi:amicyanin